MFLLLLDKGTVVLPFAGQEFPHGLRVGLLVEHSGLQELIVVWPPRNRTSLAFARCIAVEKS